MTIPPVSNPELFNEFYVSFLVLMAFFRSGEGTGRFMYISIRKMDVNVTIL